MKYVFETSIIEEHQNKSEDNADIINEKHLVFHEDYL
jgi:hypothetical protein